MADYKRIKFTKYGLGLWAKDTRAWGSLKREWAISTALALLRVALATPVDAQRLCVECTVWPAKNKSKDTQPDYDLNITAYPPKGEETVLMLMDDTELLHQLTEHLVDHPGDGNPFLDQPRGNEGHASTGPGLGLGQPRPAPTTQIEYAGEGGLADDDLPF